MGPVNRSGARAEDEGGSSGSEEWDRHAAMHAEAEADERYGRRRSAADSHPHRVPLAAARAPHVWMVQSSVRHTCTGTGTARARLDLPLKGHSRVLDEGTTGMTG